MEHLVYSITILQKGDLCVLLVHLNEIHGYFYTLKNIDKREKICFLDSQDFIKDKKFRLSILKCLKYKNSKIALKKMIKQLPYWCK